VPIWAAYDVDMADVVVFHHAQGRTDGVLAFADDVRSAGHIVHVPDLYNGATFDTVVEGVAHAETIGVDTVIDRAVEAVNGLPEHLVYAGLSLGTVAAQKLAQTRPHALGALLYHGGSPTSRFRVPWPVGVALQIHVMDTDEWMELDVAEALRDEVAGAELYVYPGSKHLFADSSLEDYDEPAAQLLLQRTVEFLSIND
jgi:dienelactone hydrolase